MAYLENKKTAKLLGKFVGSTVVVATLLITGFMGFTGYIAFGAVDLAIIAMITSLYLINDVKKLFAQDYHPTLDNYLQIGYNANWFIGLSLLFCTTPVFAVGVLSAGLILGALTSLVSLNIFNQRDSQASTNFVQVQPHAYDPQLPTFLAAYHYSYQYTAPPPPTPTQPNQLQMQPQIGVLLQESPRQCIR